MDNLNLNNYIVKTNTFKTKRVNMARIYYTMNLQMLIRNMFCSYTGLVDCQLVGEIFLTHYQNIFIQYVLI